MTFNNDDNSIFFVSLETSGAGGALPRRRKNKPETKNFKQTHEEGGREREREKKKKKDRKNEKEQIEIEHRRNEKNKTNLKKTKMETDSGGETETEPTIPTPNDNRTPSPSSIRVPTETHAISLIDGNRLACEAHELPIQTCGALLPKVTWPRRRRTHAWPPPVRRRPCSRGWLPCSIPSILGKLRRHDEDAAKPFNIFF